MKLSKKNMLIVSLSLIGIIVIALVILFPVPKEFNKTFTNAFVSTDFKTKTGNSTIEIHAKLYKRFSFKHFSSMKILDGTATIDNKKYSLIGYNLGKATNNVLYGSIIETSTSSNSKSTYTLYMMDDLNSICLWGNKCIAAPAKTTNEFKSLCNKAIGKNN